MMCEDVMIQLNARADGELRGKTQADWNGTWPSVRNADRQPRGSKPSMRTCAAFVPRRTAAARLASVLRPWFALRQPLPYPSPRRLHQRRDWPGARHSWQWQQGFCWRSRCSGPGSRGRFPGFVAAL